MKPHISASGFSKMALKPEYTQGSRLVSIKKMYHVIFIKSLSQVLVLIVEHMSSKYGYTFRYISQLTARYVSRNTS